MVRTQIPHEREYFEGVEEGGMSKATQTKAHAYFSNINKYLKIYFCIYSHCILVSFLIIFC